MVAGSDAPTYSDDSAASLVAQPRSLVRRVRRVRGRNLSNLTVANRSDGRDVHDFSLATDRTLPPQGQR